MWLAPAARELPRITLLNYRQQSLQQSWNVASSCTDASWEIFQIRFNEYLVRDISLDQCHVDYANTYVHFNWSVTLYVLQYLRIASTGQLLRMYVPCAHLVRLTYRSMYMDTHFNRRVGSSRFKYLEPTVRCVRTSLPDLQDVSS